MKESEPDKGLYTEEEFRDALAGGTQREEARAAEEDMDPLSDKNVQKVNAITLMRIYDVLSAILDHLDTEQADAVLETHKQGRLVGPLPYIDM